jgi:HEAT repeat protein
MDASPFCTLSVGSTLMAATAAVINPQTLIRRIIVAALTCTLPDEYRDDALQILTEAVNSPDDDLRAFAVIGLNELGAHPSLLLPVLTSATLDSNDQVRRRAVRSLGDLGSAALPSLPHLVCALNDQTPAVRLEAMGAIGRLGADAEEAVPALMCLLNHEDTRTRTVAGATLKRIGEAAIPYLIEGLSDPDAIMRERSAIVLGQMQPDNEQVLFALLDTCGDFDSDVRTAARRALEMIEG